MPSKVWDEITDLFRNFNGCTVEIWEWISSFIPHFIRRVLGLRLIHASKRGPWSVDINIIGHETMVCAVCLSIFLWCDETKATTCKRILSCKILQKSSNLSTLLATFHHAGSFKTEVFCNKPVHHHYSDVIMGTIASQITSLTSVYSIVYSVADQRKHQSSASLAFVRGIHRCPVNSPHKGPVTRKMFPFDDVIMIHANII